MNILFGAKISESTAQKTATIRLSTKRGFLIMSTEFTWKLERLLCRKNTVRDSIKHLKWGIKDCDTHPNLWHRKCLQQRPVSEYEGEIAALEIRLLEIDKEIKLLYGTNGS